MHTDPAVGSAHRIAIIGGGISGLAAAHRLLHASSATHITIIEAQPRVGGQIITERVDGYVIEAGPDLFLGSKPGAYELAQELGLGGHIHGTSPGVRGSYILRKGKLTRLPEGLSGLVPTRLMPFVTSSLLSPSGKLRVALDLLIPPRRDDADESVESFVVRRMGRQMYERLFEPLLSGIFAGDGSRLSILATFPQLRAFERENGGMLRGITAARARMRKTKADASASARAGFLSFSGGMQEIVDALEKELTSASDRVSIRYNARVQSIARAPAESSASYALTLGDGTRLHADAVVVATPAHQAARLLESLDPTLASLLGEVPHVSTATVTLAYPQSAVQRALDATGYTVPRAEHRAVLACTWVTSKFPGRAPAGKVVFRVFIGGAGREQVARAADAELLQIARAELREVMGVDAVPEMVRIYRWPDSMPQYNLGHLERLAAIEEIVALHSGLTLAGNAYHGVGVPDCIMSGERAARQVLASLATQVLK
jgi:oxygen-dependent protoporphyrinogen oxidase